MASVIEAVRDGQLGRGNATALRELLYERLCGLELSRRKRLELPSGVAGTQPSVMWLSLEPATSRWLVAATRDASILLYDTQTASSYDNRGAVHGPVTSIGLSHPHAHHMLVSCVDWYPVDGGIFVSGSLDGHVKVWDARRLEVAWEWEFDTLVQSVAMSPLGTHCLVAVACDDASLRICDIGSGACTHTFTQHGAAVLRSVWSRLNEYQLLSGCWNGEIRLWDIRRAGCVHLFDVHHTEGSTGVPPLMQLSEGIAHRGKITDLLQMPDGRSFLSAATDDRIIQWDAVHYARQFVQYPSAFNRSSRIRQLSVSPDGPLLFFPCGSAIQVYDVQTGAMKRTLRGHMHTVNCSFFNPVLQELYSAGSDDSIFVWEIQDGSEVTDEDAWSD